MKARYPDFKLHALSPPEVLHISRMAQLPVPAVIERLIAAGLDSIPGGGAEILVDRVRKLLHCYGKATADEWLGVMREAHRAGLRTTATMMYGTVETLEERLEHLMRLRDLQDETGGFTAFITWSFQPDHTELGLEHGITLEATGVDYLRTLAIATAGPGQLRQPAVLVGHAGRQGGAVEPALRRQRHGLGDDRGERRAGGRRGLLHGRSSRSSATSRTPVSSPSAATCTTTCWAIPSSASVTSRACSASPRRAPQGDTSVPAELVNYAARSSAGKQARGQDVKGRRTKDEGRRTDRIARAIAVLARPSSFVLRPSSFVPSMIIVRSRWLLPITDRPMLNGWVAIDHGRIAAAGRAGASLPLRDDAPLVDLGAYAVLPALVNAHVHLELSWLRGQVPRAERFTDWVPAMLHRRMTARAGRGRHRRRGRHRHRRDARVWHRGGRRHLELAGHRRASCAAARWTASSFTKCCAWRPTRPTTCWRRALRAQEAHGVTGRFPVSLAPHAPYSVSPQLFQGIRAAQARTPFLPSSVHLAESPEEVELLDTGQGPWRGLLERLGAWDPGWTPPACSPVRYLDQMRVLDSRLLAVHAVECSDEDLEVLRARGTTVVTCPRSNRYVGVGDPPVSRFYRSGVAVARGDRQPGEQRRPEPVCRAGGAATPGARVPAATLLESATVVGARALGLEATAGTIEPGKPARLIAVALPPEVVDVEEYLVSGVTPDRVHWVEDLIADCGFADRA